MKFTVREAFIINSIAIEGTNMYWPQHYMQDVISLMNKGIIEYVKTHQDKGMNFKFTSKHNCRVKREYFNYDIPIHQEMSEPFSFSIIPTY